MSDSSHEGFGVTADDIRNYDWQARIAKSERKECRNFWGVLRSEAEECDAAKDDIGQRVFSLLSAVASFRENYEDNGCHYVSMISLVDGRRSPNIEDLSDDDLAALRGIAEEIADPEFRARVADVLWLAKKDFKAAQLAVAAFVESAQRLKTINLVIPHITRLKRAAQICANRGFEKERGCVLLAIESAIAEYMDDPKSGHICHNLMLILLSVDQGDPATYSVLSEKLAKKCASTGDWYVAEMYWQIAIQWHRRAKNNDDVQRCQLAAAECNISRGEAELSKHGCMSAAHWYGKGVESLRCAKAAPERIKAVHRRFLELQKLGLKEMKHLDLEVDKIPEYRERERLAQERADAFVRGVDLQTALERFANIARPVDYEELKKAYVEASDGSVLHKIVGSSVLDQAGKVAGKIPPLGSSSPEMNSESLQKLLCQHAGRWEWPARVIQMIEPARIAILDEHAVCLQDLLFLVLNNPFIPQGHEGIYLRGLQAGFLGDWLVAMHLLVPQVEASIRHVLQQRGIITSTLRTGGVQEEKDMKDFLEMPEVEKLFGVDMVFELRGILIERFGHNLRNQLAHGLLPEGGFYREASAYLWWLILRLCWAGFRLAHLPDEETAKT